MARLIWAGLGFDPDDFDHTQTLADVHEEIIEGLFMYTENLDDRHSGGCTVGICVWEDPDGGYCEIADIFDRNGVRVGFGIISVSEIEAKTNLELVGRVLAEFGITSIEPSVWAMELPNTYNSRPPTEVPV